MEKVNPSHLVLGELYSHKEKMMVKKEYVSIEVVVLSLIILNIRIN